MRKTNDNLILLNVLFTTALVISNVVTAKLIHTGVHLFGVSVTIPGATICYAVTFLMTDIVGEIWGKKEADRTVIVGLLGQIFASVLILLIQQLPAADASMQVTYKKLLGMNWVFVLGSLTAYVVSQKWDVWIFHTIRCKYLSTHNSTTGRWLWNNGSTMTSQIIDTIIFITISFGLGFGWLFNRQMWPTLLAMIIGQYVFKLLLAAIDTPFFYLLTRNKIKTKVACQ